MKQSESERIMGLQGSWTDIGPHWHGWSSVKNFFIFGASYCDIGTSEGPRPTPELPLGIEWPGITFAEKGEPNWVGYLAMRAKDAVPPLTYCYAAGGARVDGVKWRINEGFLGASGPAKASWSADDSFCATWVGINDVAWGVDPGMFIFKLLDAHTNLYKAGVRNFMFVNLPPLHRFPGRMSKLSESGVPRECDWNATLSLLLKAWKKDTAKDAGVFLYSSYDTFLRVLDDPIASGFASDGNGILVDHLHPGTKMNKIIAEDMGKLLDGASAL